MRHSKNRKTITEFLESEQTTALVQNLIKKEKAHPSIILGQDRANASELTRIIYRSLSLILWNKLLEKSEKETILVSKSPNVEQIISAFLRNGFPSENIIYEGGERCGHYRLNLGYSIIDLHKDRYQISRHFSLYRLDRPGLPGISADDFVQLTLWFRDKLPELKAASDEIATKIAADQMVKIIQRTARNAARAR